MTPTIPDALASLAPWVASGVFGPAEIHATEVITRADTRPNHLVQLGAALALWAPLHGHVCVDLPQAMSMVATELAGVSDETEDGVDGTIGGSTLSRFRALQWPHPTEWLPALSSSNIVRVVNAADPQPVLDNCPLVLHGHSLYTQRQWIDECLVAASLRSRALTTTPSQLCDPAAALLRYLVPPTEDEKPNLQHIAALTALSARLGVIVGGPGTGKTHTVARLLAVLLVDAAEQSRPLRVALAAPTGKAAARLREAITTAANATDTTTGEPMLPATIAHQLAELPATTLHRLLGSRGLASTRFRHDAENPLPHDVVVVDETSMVALPLMARLLEAIRPDARLILVGDPDQLESVDVGAILADIVEASSSPPSPLHNCVARLNRSHRQLSGSPVGPLSDAIRDNRPHDVVTLLRAGAYDPTTGDPLLSFIEHADILSSPAVSQIRDVVLPPWVAARDAASVGHGLDALHGLASMRVLCAHRHGPHGADTWNRVIETWLLGHAPHTRFYPGRALLVTRNDPRTRLSNGDAGIVVAHPEGTRAAFGQSNEVREFAPAQLESVETAFAMTIHKSQGSEYPTVVVVLPPSTSPLIGRELLYTAVTRTTRRLIVVGTEAAVVAAVQTPARRITGLTAALRRNQG